MTPWTSLIDRQYEQALQAGAFEGLRGVGRSLRLEDNPFAGEMRLAYHLVRSQGCTLPWIEERNELLAVSESIRTALQGARVRYGTALDEGSFQQAYTTFVAEATRLNRRILAFNLRAPATIVQVAPIDVAGELRRGLADTHTRRRTTEDGRDQQAEGSAAVSRRQRPTVPASYLGLLRTYLAPQWPRVALMSALLLASIAFQVVNPQILRAFIDAARMGESSAALTNVALLFLAVVAVGQLVSALASYTSADVGLIATNRLRGDLLHHCLSLDLSFHKEHAPGELIERVEGDVTALAHFFSQFVVQVVGNSLLLLAVLAVLFGEDWRVGVALRAFVICAFLLLQRLQGIAVPAITAARAANTELTGFWEERLRAREDLRPNGATAHTLRQLDRLLVTLLRRVRTDRMLFRAYVATWAVLLALGNALAFGVGAWLYWNGAMTLGAVYMVFAYTGLLAWNLGRITDHLNELQRAAASIGRIAALASTRSALADGPGAALSAGPLGVEFRGVTFGYDVSTTDRRPQTEDGGLQPTVHGQRSTVLTDLSFHLAPGTILGLMGRTGSGKTTVGRLLFRCYDPQAGQIFLGGVDLRDLALADLRRRVAFVTQRVQIFAGSVRDNLTLFDETIPDERILATLEELGLSPWLARLPEGLDSPLTGGDALSAGEAQLLAFARVFLRDPQVIVLDEASALLDPASEQLLEQALDRLLAGRTAIIIAHRPQTLRRADLVLVLEGA